MSAWRFLSSFAVLLLSVPVLLFYFAIPSTQWNYRLPWMLPKPASTMTTIPSTALVTTTTVSVVLQHILQPLKSHRSLQQEAFDLGVGSELMFCMIVEASILTLPDIPEIIRDGCSCLGTKVSCSVKDLCSDNYQELLIQNSTSITSGTVVEARGADDPTVAEAQCLESTYVEISMIDNMQNLEVMVCLDNDGNFDAFQQEVCFTVTSDGIDIQDPRLDQCLVATYGGQECSNCTVCENGQGLDIDCSNHGNTDTTTNGCLPLLKPDAFVSHSSTTTATMEQEESNDPADEWSNDREEENDVIIYENNNVIDSGDRENYNISMIPLEDDSNNSPNSNATVDDDVSDNPEPDNSRDPTNSSASTSQQDGNSTQATDTSSSSCSCTNAGFGMTMTMTIMMFVACRALTQSTLE